MSCVQEPKTEPNRNRARNRFLDADDDYSRNDEDKDAC